MHNAQRKHISSTSLFGDRPFPFYSDDLGGLESPYLGAIGFAKAQRYCIALGYKGTVRIIQSFYYRKTQKGDFLLMAIRYFDHQERSYRMDRIESLKVTEIPFFPPSLMERPSRNPDMLY